MHDIQVSIEVDLVYNKNLSTEVIMKLLVEIKKKALLTQLIASNIN